MPDLPDWVEDQKETGMEIRKRGDGYYAYKITSKWDPEKGRPQKITEAYLGVVTPEGIIPPKHKRGPEAILETGNILLVRDVLEPLEAPLQEAFPGTWQTLLATAALKCCYQAPIKRFQHHHQTSWAQEIWPDATLSKNAMTDRLREWGRANGKRREVFRAVGSSGDRVAIDLTQVYSESENIDWLEKGHSSREQNRNQLQLLLLYDLSMHAPVFLKLLPGSLRDVSTLQNAVVEAGFEDVLLVGDKGFWSAKNLDALGEGDLGYLVAVRRNATFLEYLPHPEYEEYFEWQDRYIWGRSYTAEPDANKKYLADCEIHHFLDLSARDEEESTLLGRIEDGHVEEDELEQRREELGTLAIVTNREFSPEEAYKLYKQRFEIEIAFDVLVNTLESDKTYMQDREAIQGYMFMLFLALYAHTAILQRLRNTDLVGQYSVADVFAQLSKIYRVVVDDEMVDSEVPKQTHDLAKELEVPITQNR